jgi:hypothetical protein
MIKIYLFLLSLFFSLSCSAAIYQWKDANGLMHFSDQPTGHAKLITLPVSQSYRANVTSLASSDKIKSKGSPVSYSRLEIVSPKENEIFNNSASENIPAKVNLEPSLHLTDALEIFVDGHFFEKTKGVDSVFLSNLPRGQHTVEMKVVDDKNNLLVSSQRVNFFVQKFHLAAKK